MVNNNNLVPVEVKKPFETVQELKNEIPSFEEFMKNYETDDNLNYVDLSSWDIGTPKGCGPVDWKKKSKEDHLITTLNRTVSTFDKHDWWDEDVSACQYGNLKTHNITTSSGRSVGAGGMMIGGSASYSAIKVGDSDANIGFGGISVGAEAGMGVGGYTAGYSASVSVVDGKAGLLRGKVGLDGGSSVRVGVDGFETKVAGFGISVGKKTGISFGVGEISIDTDDCVIQ